MTGYAVVSSTVVLRAGKLSPKYSAQAAELIALTEACKLMTDKEVTIYTDSQYAFATVHTFAQYWQNRGMVTSTGKPVTHAELLMELLKAVQLPKRLAICKCAAHTNGRDTVSLGNAFTDKTAKAAAEGKIEVLNLDIDQDIKVDILQQMQQQSPKSEQDYWIKQGAQLKEGIYK